MVEAAPAISLGHGLCVLRDGTHVCECYDGWSGPYCSIKSSDAQVSHIQYPDNSQYFDQWGYMTYMTGYETAQDARAFHTSFYNEPYLCTIGGVHSIMNVYYYQKYVYIYMSYIIIREIANNVVCAVRDEMDGGTLRSYQYYYGLPSDMGLVGASLVTIPPGVDQQSKVICLSRERS